MAFLPATDRSWSTPRRPRALGFVLGGLSLLAGCASAQPDAGVGVLDPAIQAQLDRARADHDLVFELAERYDANFAPNVNLSEDVLKEIVVPVEADAVPGGVRVPLSDEFCRVGKHFKALWVRGTRMENTTAVTLSQHGETREVKWDRYGQGILLRPYQLDVGDGRGVYLIIGGDVAPEALHWESAGLSAKFDPSPYRGVGENRPPREAAVNVSTRRWRSIGGVSELDRTRYFRIYSQPNNERYPQHREELETLGFQQGRQIFKFGPGLERGYGERDWPLLTEDPDRPGYADPAFFSDYIDKAYSGLPDGLRFAMCFDDWPSFMEAVVANHANDRGTPADFDAAADLVAHYLNNQIKHSGRTADWWEVKNESDISYEWTFHGDPDADGWGLLIDFHNKIADAVHGRVDPAIKVGGPTAAWPAFEANNFDRWRDYARFHDGTAEHLDFYSYHFYYPTVYGAIDPDGYLDARLDMLQSHMHATGNVKPLVVSEFGTIGTPAAGTADGIAWTKSKGFSTQWMRYLERPDEFDLVVPFMLGFIHWSPTSRSGVWAQDEGGAFYRTPNHNVMRLWSEFHGRRVPVSSKDLGLLHHAVLDGDTLYVALNNQGSDRAAVDLQLDGDAATDSVTQKRFYFSRGELRYEENDAVDLSAVPINVGETTVLVIRLSRTPQTTGVRAERSFYGVGTARPNTGEPITFRIAVSEAASSGEVVDAELRLGLHREGPKGLGGAVEVSINGHAVKHGLSRFGQDGYFGYARIALPPEAIRPENDIKIRFAEPGGTLTAARLTVVTDEPN